MDIKVVRLIDGSTVIGKLVEDEAGYLLEDAIALDMTTYSSKTNLSVRSVKPFNSSGMRPLSVPIRRDFCIFPPYDPEDVIRDTYLQIISGIVIAH